MIGKLRLREVAQGHKDNKYKSENLNSGFKNYFPYFMPLSALSKEFAEDGARELGTLRPMTCCGCVKAYKDVSIDCFFTTQKRKIK